MLSDREKTLAGNRLGFFGKGGSGKSTVAILLAKVLRDLGYEVCVLDADSTNVGLARALGADMEPAPLLDHYGGMVFSGGQVTCPVDDPTPLLGAEVQVKELPGEYQVSTPDGIHLFVAGKMGDKGPGAGCDGPIAKIARDFRPLYGGESAASEPPVTIVDYKAGFEDSARGNIVSLDWIVVVVDPTSAAVQMAINMREMVDQLKAGRQPATAHLEHPDLVELARRLYREARVKDVLFVLNKVRDRETETYLRHKLAEHGIEPIGLIHDDPALAAAWLRGAPLAGGSTQGEVREIAEAIELAQEEIGSDRIASVV